MTHDEIKSRLQKILDRGVNDTETTLAEATLNYIHELESEIEALETELDNA